MRMNADGSFLEEAMIDALNSVYELTMANPEFYYTPQAIVWGMKRKEIYGNLIPREVSKLLERYIEEGLVRQVKIVKDPTPANRAGDMKIGYKANLERKEEIFCRISRI